MKIIRALGLVTTIVGIASWLDARSARQREARREREIIDRTRWESEGGATPSGPHISETLPNQTSATSSVSGLSTAP
jgi:hypothetical protein